MCWSREWKEAPTAGDLPPFVRFGHGSRGSVRMGGMLGVSRFIDRLTGWLGEVTAWLALVCVLVGAST